MIYSWKPATSSVRLNMNFGDSYERREIVQDWMTDGEIIALKERLEQLRKEETYGRIEYPNGYAA